MGGAAVAAIERFVFRWRYLLIAVFAALTLVMGYFAAQLRVDAGFEKFLPLKHAYMETYLVHKNEFGGANRVLIALRAREGTIFQKPFFDALKKATDAAFFIEGVDRTRLQSLFTPNVRFIEIVEDGFAGGNVIPADFVADAAGLDRVRENIIKSGTVGRLVSNDFTMALISAQLLDVDPATGRKVDYMQVADALESQLRSLANDQVDVHIIGFAKFVGDISAGARGVVMFFGIAILVTVGLVYLYARCWVLTLLPLATSIVAVVWQIGTMSMLGLGLDPMSILIPFLIFAIGVSHSVQMVNGIARAHGEGQSMDDASRTAFRGLLLPGAVALATDTIGFLTLLLIEIRIIQELAMTASLGVAAIILTNLVLLPLLVSLARLPKDHAEKIAANRAKGERLWRLLAEFARPRVAAATIGVAVVLAVLGALEARHMQIGDAQPGYPELRADSRYNRDALIITERFSIGVDLISVIVETRPDACIDHGIMENVERFTTAMRSVEGVRSTMSLPAAAKMVNAAWNEGNPKWRVIPRNPQVLVRAVTPIDTATGLLSPNCSVMPVMIFTEDHKAATITRVVNAVKSYAAANDTADTKFKLATGNVGVMAASNEAVAAAELPMLYYIYGAVLVLCVATFRSWRAALCIILPLALVSLLANALMSLLGIGLTTSTLPVAALGVGIGVDYGIYIFSQMNQALRNGESFYHAYRQTLRNTGSAVLFTGLTLALGVGTWLFSDLKFQADMGILLTFMFILNMLGAVLLLPALACWLERLAPRRPAAA